MGRQCNGDAVTPATPVLHLQLRKIPVVIGFLLMGNGDADYHLRNTLRDKLLVTMVAGLQPLVMENGEGCVVPAARDAGRGPCLLPSDAGEGWQWSQWREQRYPKRYTVSFEGRSLP